MNRAVIQEKLFEYIKQATDKKLQRLYQLEIKPRAITAAREAYGTRRKSLGWVSVF